MKKLKKTLGILAGAGALLYAGLFAVFYFDLDGKLLFYVVEPFLKSTTTAWSAAIFSSRDMI